jgi:hypothetical protein
LASERIRDQVTGRTRADQPSPAGKAYELGPVSSADLDDCLADLDLGANRAGLDHIGDLQYATRATTARFPVGEDLRSCRGGWLALRRPGQELAD